MARRKTWTEKLDNGREPKVVTLDKPWAGMQPGTKMLVATPRLVKEYIEAIPEGETATVAQMRRDLAERFGADVTCPTSTGIFVRIVREAAAESEGSGGPATPVARLVPARSSSGTKDPRSAAVVRRTNPHATTAV